MYDCPVLSSSPLKHGALSRLSSHCDSLNTQILASNLVLAILLITTLKYKMFLCFSLYDIALSLLSSLLFPLFHF